MPIITLKTIPDIEAEIIDDFQFSADWLERYEYIIDLGRQLPPLPVELQSEQYKIHGCQAQVWIVPEFKEGHLTFRAMSDAAIVQGLIAILLKIYNNQTPEDILTNKPHFVSQIGLDKHLSPTRSNGLHHMLEAIFKYANEYKNLKSV
jgi:cysteine desulfuration protein SufE